MSPTISIARGERVVQVELTDEDAQQVAHCLESGRLHLLVDPETRRPYKRYREVADKVLEMGKILFEAGKE